MTITTAYTEGYDAYYAEANDEVRGDTGNPYPVGTPEEQEWEQGLEAAMIEWEENQG